jgi:prepilin-type processing-associated H-X9-DG protein/prepilin-type N-terminal cleavage/methylation domain-containing protein
MISRMRSRARAFTLVEMLVTVGIIALLMGILLPGLRAARRASYATTSQSNLRQWGVAMGAWMASNDDAFPWEGSKVAADMGSNLAVREFWPNALPSMLGIDTYAEMCERAFQAQTTVETWDAPGSVWSDPAAEPNRDGPYTFGTAGPEGVFRQFFFSYAMNYRLNQTLLMQAGVPEASRDVTMRMAQVGQPDKTVFMLELRASDTELPPNDPHRNGGLDRAICGWKKFAARHNGGGHMTFADGHVAWYSNEQATTNVQGSRAPATPGGDWNTSVLVWDALGPALN